MMASRMLATRSSRALFSTMPHPYADLAGKVCVVAGAGNPPSERHGLGAMTAITLARYGAKVVSVSHIAENSETLTAAIQAEGNEACHFVGDMRDYDQVTALKDFAVEKYGTCDVLINAGIHDALPNGFKKMTLEKWKSNMDLNLNCHFHLIHAFIPLFHEKGSGNIIHFNTFGGAVSLGMGPQRHGYFAGKGGAAILTRRIGIENSKKNIRGNVLAIGYAEGPLVDRAVAQAGADPSAVDAARGANVPRGTQITPDEVAGAACFLASDASSSINAAEIFADGGNHGCTYGP